MLLVLLAAAFGFCCDALVVEMRYGKRDVKIRSSVSRQIQKATTPQELNAVSFERAGWKMKRRLSYKLNAKAYSIGHNLAPPAPPPQEDPPPVPVEEGKVFSSGSIAEQVDLEVKLAMKAKDKVALSTLRLIKSALSSAAKDAGVEFVEDAEAVKVLRKLAKMRQESIDMYEKAGPAGEERAQAEKAELVVISKWLPQLADEDAVRKWISEVMEKIDDKTNKGKIMGALMKEHKEEIDGKMAQRLVGEMTSA